MNREPSLLCSLPPPSTGGRTGPEELEQRARRHLDGLFGEVRGAGDYLRTEWRPLRLIRKHPVAAAAVIGVAGLALARLVRGSRRAPGAAAAGATRAAESLGRTVGRSLLAGLAGSAATLLPELVLALLRRGGSGRPGGPSA
jgi:hypothetical protein